MNEWNYYELRSFKLIGLKVYYNLFLLFFVYLIAIVVRCAPVILMAALTSILSIWVNIKVIII